MRAQQWRYHGPAITAQGIPRKRVHAANRCDWEQDHRKRIDPSVVARLRKKRLVATKEGDRGTNREDQSNGQQVLPRGIRANQDETQWRGDEREREEALTPHSENRGAGLKRVPRGICRLVIERGRDSARDRLRAFRGRALPDASDVIGDRNGEDW